MPCNFICLFCTKVIVGFCILHKSLALTLPCHFPPAPHLPVALMVLPVENGAFSAACTQLVGRQDLQIVSTNTEQDFFSPSFFQPAHSHSYHSRAIKVFKERSVLSKPRHFFPLLHSAPVCSPLKLCFGLMRVWRSSLHGLFLWRSNLETPNAKVIYLAVHPLLGFVRRERKGSGPYCIS